MHDSSIIQQVKQLAAVDFVEADVQFQVSVQIEELDNVIARQEVEAGHGAIARSHHSECFTATSLSVGKAGGFCALKSLRDERQDTFLVDLIIVGSF